MGRVPDDRQGDFSNRRNPYMSTVTHVNEGPAIKTEILTTYCNTIFYLYQFHPPTIVSFIISEEPDFRLAFFMTLVIQNRSRLCHIKSLTIHQRR